MMSTVGICPLLKSGAAESLINFYKHLAYTFF